MDINNKDESLVENHQSMWIFHQVSWLKPIDGYILDFLGLYPKVDFSAKTIAFNIDYGYQYTNKRCRMLSEEELIKESESEYYTIQENGYKLLKLEIDQKEIQDKEYM